MSFRISTFADNSVDFTSGVIVFVLDTSCKLPDVVSAQEKKEITKHLKELKFSGVWGSSELFVASKEFSADFIAVVGVGSEKFSIDKKAEGVRRGIGMVVQNMRRQMIRDMAIYIGDSVSFACAACEGVFLSDYRFVDHRKKLLEEQKARSIQSLVFLADTEYVRAVKKGISDTRRVLSGVTLTRSLVNQPASHMSPAVLVKHARLIAKSSKSITVRVMNRAQAKKKGFTAFLAVARGSKEMPYVMHLIYKPRVKAKKKIVLVGKGITFDSGGLSIKPANAMEAMKIDMGGAAVVLGVFSILEKLRVPIEVHGVIAACENMPSGEAYRPGDVVKARNGKTIEVANTDAEGRVTLADSLDYASDLKPDVIIDFATLTGASMVALGNTYAGLWSNNDELKDGLLTSAQAAGEGLAYLPMPEEYKQTIESKVADVRNISSMNSYGGAITAALFLQEFVSDVPWAHVDIAGPVYAEQPILSYWQYGGTGYGVRTVVEYLKSL